MEQQPRQWILAIDPGSDKVGFAEVFYDLSHGEMGIVFLGDLHRLFKRLCVDAADKPDAVIIGNGTAAAVVCRLYNNLEIDIPVRFAEEKNTTYKARARYFMEHPPTGLWKLVPIGMQLPPRPIDDYAAWLIGEKYLAEHSLAQLPAKE